MTGKKHGPLRSDRYFEIHARAMGRFVEERFVLHDGVIFTPVGQGRIIGQGTLECIDGIDISVLKTLQITDAKRGPERVHTVAYGYHANLRTVGPILRHDGPHPHHHQYHHVHRYDVLSTGAEIVKPVEDDTWPTLGEFVDEVRDWHSANRETILRALGAE